MFLFFIILIFSTFLLQKASIINKEKVNVLFLYDNQIEENNKNEELLQVKNVIKQVLNEEENNENNKTLIDIQLIVWPIERIKNDKNNCREENYGCEPNRLWITQDLVCTRLLNSSSLVVLTQSERADITAFRPIKSTLSAVASALGFYRVPTIGANIKDTEFSRKNLYPTFLRTSPPYSDDAIAMVRVLSNLEYRQIVLITIEADQNGAEFAAALAAHKIHIQAHITLNLGSKSLEELKNNLLEELTEYTANTVLLCAKQSDSEIIFNASTKFTGAGRVWLLSEAASNAKNIPKGALSIRLKQSMISSLRDGLAVAKAGIKSFKQNNSLKFNPPKGCQHSVSEWTNFAEEKLFDELKRQPIYETLSGEQINFNERGDRKGMTYEILNAKEFGGHLVVVGNLNGRGELILDDRAIIWPGGLRRKPSELTLPKHLRVTLVVDPPFVYAFKVDEYSRCSKLQFLNNPTINVEGFQVSGPWFPCEKLDNNKKEFYCCSGMAVELLFLISEVADNSFSFELKLNDSYGAVLLGEQEGEGFKLTGMIGELDADRADMAIGALSINPERDRFIDFSEPWLYHGIQILELAFVVYFLDLKSPFERFYSSGQDPLFEKAEQEERIMVASYTANLAAFLVLDQPERSLSGVNDPRLRNPSANFSLATITHSATYQYFKRHVELSTVFRKMEANNQPNARSAIQALLNGSISAFVWDSVRLEFEAANNCELRTRGALFGRSAYGIGLRKGSAWTPHISQAILRLSENGTLECLEQKWIRSPNKNFRPCFHFEPKAPARLGLRSMRDGLVLVAS
uniref:Ionotropic glutamate receptor C-terminal domain-containing protein n=1 Tax=Meloidogyne javanica TaxID=6303 RepID=A0A915LUN3_MELJA